MNTLHFTCAVYLFVANELDIYQWLCPRTGLTDLLLLKLHLFPLSLSIITWIPCKIIFPSWSYKRCAQFCWIKYSTLLYMRSSKITSLNSNVIKPNISILDGNHNIHYNYVMSPYVILYYGWPTVKIDNNYSLLLRLPLHRLITEYLSTLHG